MLRQKEYMERMERRKEEEWKSAGQERKDNKEAEEMIWIGMSCYNDGITIIVYC